MTRKLTFIYWWVYELSKKIRTWLKQNKQSTIQSLFQSTPLTTAPSLLLPSLPLLPFPPFLFLPPPIGLLFFPAKPGTDSILTQNLSCRRFCNLLLISDPIDFLSFLLVDQLVDLLLPVLWLLFLVIDNEAVVLVVVLLAVLFLLVLLEALLALVLALFALFLFSLTLALSLTLGLFLLYPLLLFFVSSVCLSLTLFLLDFFSLLFSRSFPLSLSSRLLSLPLSLSLPLLLSDAELLWFLFLNDPALFTSLTILLFMSLFLFRSPGYVRL